MPPRERALRVRVEQERRAPGFGGKHTQMHGERGLTNAALSRRYRDDLHTRSPVILPRSPQAIEIACEAVDSLLSPHDGSEA